MRYHLCTLLIVLAVAGTSFCTSADTFADQWQPWPNQLFPSANGKYYVIMNRTGGPIVAGEWGPVEFEIAKVGVGNAPAEAVTGKVADLSGREDAEGHTYPQGTYRMTSRVAVREGDHLLGRGKLDRPPLCVLVSSSGLGFVGLDVYGYNYAYDEEGWKKATAAILVNAKGEVAHKTALTTLYAEDELEGFEATAGGLDWLHRQIPGWIDDGKKRVVIVAAPSDRNRNRFLIRFVDWETGKSFVGTTLKAQDEIEDLRKETSRPAPR